MKNIKKKILIPLLAGISLIITACSESGEPVPQIQHESILQSIENTIENSPASFELSKEIIDNTDKSTNVDNYTFIYNTSSKSFHIKDNTPGATTTEVYHKYGTYYEKKDGKWYKKDSEDKLPHREYSGSLFPEWKALGTMLKYKDDIKIEENSKNYIIEFTPKNEELLKKYHTGFETIDKYNVKMIVDKSTFNILSSVFDYKYSFESSSKPGKIIARDRIDKLDRKILINNETIDLPAEANNAVTE